MRIVVLCATQRGYRFLHHLLQLAPEHDFVVFSFREEAWEPRFFDDIRELTLARGQHFFEARQVGTARWEAFWQSTTVDLLFAVSWRYLVPSAVYARCQRGAFIFHDSLLPQYRGFAPTVWAIINGEPRSGVTLFQIAEEVDAGGIIDQYVVPLGPDVYIADVMEQVTRAYLLLLERNIDTLLYGDIHAVPQDEAQATYTCKRLPDDNVIDWTHSSEQIYNLIRAVSYPYPGAFTSFRDQKLFIWAAQPVPEARRYVGRIPGRIVEVRAGSGVVVLAGDGALLVSRVQLEGQEPVRADMLLNSLSYTLGTK